MRARLRRLRREERGVVLVLVAVCMVAFLGMAALAIDIGSFYHAQRQAQAAADAGALAGADDLSTNPTGVTVDAQSLAQTNFPSASTATVSEPTSTSVKVTVSASTPSFFGRFLGLTQANVSASAVATAKANTSSCVNPGSSCYAVFAMDRACGSSSTPFTGGGGITITGGLHSNGSVNFGGGGSSFGQVTYGTGCTLSPSQWAQNGNTFTPSSGNPASEAPILTWPIPYALDFPSCSGASCTGACDNGSSSCSNTYRTPSFCTQASNQAAWSINTYNPATLTSGNVYCDVGTGTPGTPSTWNGTLSAAGGPVEATLVAGSVTIGGGTQLETCGYAAAGYTASGCSPSVPTPSTTNYPAIYAIGGGIDASSGGGTFTGDLYAPMGTITIGGGDSTAFLEGYDVNWSSGGIRGDGPDVSGSGSSSSSGASLTQ